MSSGAEARREGLVSQPAEVMETPLGQDARILLLIVGILTLGVGLLLYVLPAIAGVGGTDPTTQQPVGDQFWPWPLRTPLNSRFFGGFFLSVGLGAVLALREPTWERVRILFPPGIIFTGLGLVAALMSFSSFKPERVVTWAFFALYAFVLLGELWIYVNYERRRSRGR